jgi:hypothetical protein
MRYLLEPVEDTCTSVSYTWGATGFNGKVPLEVGRLVVTADIAPVYVQPDAEARVVGTFSNGVQVRAMGSDTATSRF